jgi:hypothetical protein
MNVGALTLNLKDNLDLAAVVVDHGGGCGVDTAKALAVVDMGVLTSDLKHRFRLLGLIMAESGGMDATAARPSGAEH